MAAPALAGGLLAALLAVAPAGAADDPLLGAIRSRDFAAARALVRAGADVNVAFEDGKTPLMVAGREGLAGLVAELLAAGAQVNATNRNGGTALMFAAITGDARTMELLLAAGAQVDATGSNGWNAIMVAAVKGHAAVVRMLLARGADPNLADVYGWTPLMRAASRNRTGTVTALLDDPRTDLARRDDGGATALHHAAEEGHQDMVSLLVRRGADPGVQDAMGHTPSERATLAGYEQLARRLASAPAPRTTQ